MGQRANQFGFGFNTQPPEGGWASNRKVSDDCLWFQHTAARRRLGRLPKRLLKSTKFQHTAARRRLVDVNLRSLIGEHSFNTQPPEGGWTFSVLFEKPFSSFNTQPPEGGWLGTDAICFASSAFQHTAARRRLDVADSSELNDSLRFNTQPPEGGWGNHACNSKSDFVSTHSRPKAAGIGLTLTQETYYVSTHSRPKAAGGELAGV